LFALIQDKVGSWFSNPGAGGRVSKYLTTWTAGSSDATGNATSANGSSKKRKGKVLIIVFQFPLKLTECR
jgi:hypothetical protein